MFYIVETVAQLERLKKFKKQEAFIQIILTSETIHPILDKPSLIYYRPLSEKHGFLLAIDHTETLSLDLDTIISFLNALEAQIWTIDKKETLYQGLNESVLKGLKMAYTLSGNMSFPDIAAHNTTAHKYYRHLLRPREDINRFIPVSKHLEKWDTIFEILQFDLNPEGFLFYNSLVFNSIKYVEEQGIAIDVKLFNKLHPGYIEHRNISDDRIYSSYHLYNSTARPSCKFNGFNFMAMPKTGDIRKCIIPKNDILVEFDFKSYQIKLLANLLGYQFQDNIHEELGRMYFNVDELTEEQYNQSKKMTFQLAYGRKDEIPDIPFYRDVYMFRNNLWNEFKTKGYITSPLSGRKISNMTENTQILPFLMQCLETERNMQIINDVRLFLRNKKTRLIFYCYDSFLFDVSKKDGITIITDIAKILEKDGYKTNETYGMNYQEMIP